ncbi:MAG: hypothetical protein FWE01_00775 [Firmicutes bacterium]|nr:hypothetical protein [Bacillota bacterium]
MKKSKIFIAIVTALVLGIVSFAGYSMYRTIDNWGNWNNQCEEITCDNVQPTKFDGIWMLRFDGLGWNEETSQPKFGDAGIVTITNGMMDWKYFEEVQTEVSVVSANGQIVLHIFSEKSGFTQAYFLTHHQETNTLRYYFTEEIWENSELIGTQKSLLLYLTKV